MKKVIFIKAHPVGISEGHVAAVRDSTADRWINQGYAEIHSETDSAPLPVDEPAIPVVPDEPKQEQPKKGGKKK